MAQTKKLSVSPAKTAPKASRFRRILAQVVATTIKNLLLFDLGLCFSLPTIIIPALTGLPNENNCDEFLTITDVQASWLSSIGYLIQPFGSLLSALMTDPLGRKRSMILVNIPYLIGWIMLCRANSVVEVFLGFLMLGLAVGLMEAPVVTYLGEICEPSTRGVLIGYTFISATIGMFTIYLLNTMMAWRTVAMICCAVPVFTTIAMCFIPETPQWLLSKNRTEEAEKSLRWLRGWVPSHMVADEFADLQRHSDRSKSCNLCIKQNVKCTHPLPTMREKFAELKRKRTLKPFAIIMSLFFLAQFSGVFSMRPFIVQIFKAYDSPISPDRAAAIMSLLDNLANVTFMCLVRFTGKRRVYLAMLSGVFLCALTVTTYGFMFLPSGYISFAQSHQPLVNQTLIPGPCGYMNQKLTQSHQPFQLENKNLTYIPLVSLLLWSFFSFCGFAGMPWMFLSELFPFKSRGIASGVAAALNYVFGFITKKTYYNLETTLSMPGVSLMYCIICGCGLIFTYIVLPETEDRSLEDIELHFSDNSKSIIDRKITKSKSTHKTIINSIGDVYQEKSNGIKNKSSDLGYDNKAFDVETSKV